MKNSSLIFLLQPTNLYEEAERRYHEISEHIREIEKKLQKAPSGMIHIAATSARTQYYLRETKADRGGRYIRKSDTKTIGTFLRKAYDEKLLKLLKTEAKNLGILLKKTDHITERIRQLYSNLPTEAKPHIDPIEMSDEDFAAEWLNDTYESREIPEYVPVYETNRGERVRSKSELSIANILADRGIPYKYERPLLLTNGMVIYPDFTVLDVKARKEFYWEHRGMMDERDYARQAVLKMKSMLNSGIVPGKDLIITEETSANPLGTNEIHEVINCYLRQESSGE